MINKIDIKFKIKKAIIICISTLLLISLIHAYSFLLVDILSEKLPKMLLK